MSRQPLPGIRVVKRSKTYCIDDDRRRVQYHLQNMESMRAFTVLKY